MSGASEVSGVGLGGPRYTVVESRKERVSGVEGLGRKGYTVSERVGRSECLEFLGGECQAVQ